MTLHLRPVARYLLGVAKEDHREPPMRSDFSIHVHDWDTADEIEAREYGEKVMHLTTEMSRHLDLSELEKIVLSYDYCSALASIDRGPGLPAAEATSNEFGVSGAMALVVKRDDDYRKVLVIWTPLVRKLFDETDEKAKQFALNMFIHELVHIDDFAFLKRTFPGGVAGTKENDARHGALLAISSPAPSEYSATHRSAFLNPAYGIEFIEMLRNALHDAETEIASEVVKYRFHGDLERLWGFVRERARFIFQAVGYALGHADWVADPESEVDPAIKVEHADALDAVSAGPLGWVVEEARPGIRAVYDQTEWSSLDVYDQLNEVAEKLLNEFGLHTSLRDDELYIDIP